MCLQNYKKYRGLTLIEMLIAMTLLATIMGLLGNTFFQTDSFSKEMDARIELRKKIRNLKNIIIRDFSRAIYLENFTKPILGKPNNLSGIVGQKGITQEIRHDVVFMHVNASSLFRNNLDLAKDPELHEIGYFLSANQDGVSFKLFRREDYYIDDTFDFPESNPVISEVLDSNKSITHELVSDILYFKVEYLPNVKDDEGQWKDEWNSSKQTRGNFIPYTIKVTLKFPVLPIDDILTNFAADESGEPFSANSEHLVITEKFQINLRWALSSGVTWNF